MRQPTWPPPPAPESEMGRLNSALREIPSYDPPVSIDGPIRSTSPSRWMRIPTERPVVTYVLLGIMILIFIPMALSDQLNNSFTEAGALVKLDVIRGEWWRLITATFLHAGWLHIGLNGYALYLIGRELEAFFGRARFIAVYAISGLAGSVASFIFIPFTIGGATVTGVGASGAIFGLIGALGVYFGLNRHMFGKLGQAQFWNIVVVIVLNMAIGFSGIFPIDNSAHIGGLLAGAAVGFILCPRYRLGSWRNPLVREIENTNKGLLPWIGTALVALVVIALFVAALLYFRQGY